MENKELKQVENLKENANMEATTKKPTSRKDIQLEIVKKQKDLQKCIEDLNRKKQLLDNRTRFIETLDKLDGYIEKLDPNDIESKMIKISLFDSSESRYGDNVVISNTDIVRFYIVELKKKIEEKVLAIETELVE